jgi:hypothetical protein
MADESNTDISAEKIATLSSHLNENAPSFEPSSSFEHIEETQQRRLSTEDTKNHLHIQSVQNGDQIDQNDNSSNIQSIDPSENNSTETHFIEESTRNNFNDNQDPISPSHIEPVTISYVDAFEQSTISQSEQEQINEISLEESNHSDDQQDLNTFNKTEEQSNTFYDDEQINHLHNQDDSELLLDDPLTNIHPTIHEKPDELK